MAEGNATSTNNASGETSNNAIVGWRDANTTLGALDMFNASASSTTGDIILGDVISGHANTGGVGLAKTFLIAAIGFVGYYFYKKGI